MAGPLQGRRDGHSSGAAVANRLKQPTRITRTGKSPGHQSPVIPIRFCSRWGLPCRRCYQKRGALLPHLFTLARPRRTGRFVFCGTVPEVTLAGCYPAPFFHGARTFLALRRGRPTDWPSCSRPVAPPFARYLISRAVIWPHRAAKWPWHCVAKYRSRSPRSAGRQSG